MPTDNYAAQEQRHKIAMRLAVDNFARMDQERLRRRKNFQRRDAENTANERSLIKVNPRKTCTIDASELFVGIFCKTTRADAVPRTTPK